MPYEKYGEDSLGKGLYLGPCSECKNQGDAASHGAGFDCCWGYHPKNRSLDGRMKCFQPKQERLCEVGQSG